MAIGKKDAKTAVAGIIPGLTRQRQVVLQVVRGSEEHLTASEVYQSARKLLPTISYATVYNSLRHLKEAGLIHEITGFVSQMPPPRKPKGDAALPRSPPMQHCIGRRAPVPSTARARPVDALTGNPPFAYNRPPGAGFGIGGRLNGFDDVQGG